MMSVDRKDLLVLAALVVYGWLAGGVGWGTHEHGHDETPAAPQAVESPHESSAHSH